ncbi:hypothetical protein CAUPRSCDRAFT_13206, partial [Caulochytrium protostelioides]
RIDRRGGVDAGQRRREREVEDGAEVDQRAELSVGLAARREREEEALVDPRVVEFDRRRGHNGVRGHRRGDSVVRGVRHRDHGDSGGGSGFGGDVGDGFSSDFSSGLNRGFGGGGRRLGSGERGVGNVGGSGGNGRGGGFDHRRGLGLGHLRLRLGGGLRRSGL